VPFGWVTGDTVYGGDRRLRIWLEEHAIRHVMAVKCTEPVWTLTDRGPGQVAAQDLLAQVEPAQWLRLNAGDGSKGKRFYDWTRVPLWRWGWPTNVGFWLLARRSLSDPGELAYYVCFAPADTPLVTLVQVAGRRWRVEEAFEQAKGEVGLDHYQVRQYLAWYRHVRPFGSGDRLPRPGPGCGLPGAGRRLLPAAPLRRTPPAAAGPPTRAARPQGHPRTHRGGMTTNAR
jgi:SRSO17 transposase